MTTRFTPRKQITENHQYEGEEWNIEGECRWFLFCENEAVTTRHCPPLGDVPICGRCETKMRRIESKI
jgi:hypothetical protein